MRRKFVFDADKGIKKFNAKQNEQVISNTVICGALEQKDKPPLIVPSLTLLLVDIRHFLWAVLIFTIK